MHLSPDDLTAAMDGSLREAAKAHLETCVGCREAVAELSILVANVKADPVPEPSPLFWDHFSARVREATAREPTPDRSFWRRVHPGWALGALAAIAVIVTVWSFPPRDPDVAPETQVAGASVEGSNDPEVAWRAMSDLAASMSADDVRTATAAAPGPATVLSELSDDERAAFVALVKTEMGDVQ
jgi:hypothetical protein